MRLNKYLALCNLGSRRDSEKYIVSKRIKINGKVVEELGVSIDPDKDEVYMDSKLLVYEEKKIYLMMNKPKNYLVSHKDDFKRKLVYDLLPDFDCHLFAVGRLDYQSEGLLLFTSDGKFANEIIHPRYKLPKVYKVLCKSFIKDEAIEQLKKGVKIETGMTQKAKVFIKNRTAESTLLRITIYEGKKRQIRLMIKKIGSEVRELKRLQIGDLKLSNLPVGMWRFLKPSEILELWNFHKRKKAWKK